MSLLGLVCSPFLSREETYFIACGRQGHMEGGVSLPQSCMLLNKGSDLSLFRKIIHKHQGELPHRKYRSGHSRTSTVTKHAYTYITCSKMAENLHWEEILVLEQGYNENRS